MRYYVEVGGRSYWVELGAGEVTPTPPDMRRAGTPVTPTPRDMRCAGTPVIVDGRPLRAELESVPGTNVRHLLLDGRSHTLDAAPTNGQGGWELHLDGRRLDVEALDERTRAIRAMTSKTQAARGPKPVRAPMPGLVVRIEVEPGQAVRAGEGVAIIEAMKMENELRADGAGVVSRVLVAPGKAVDKGEVLVEFEALDPARPTAGTDE